MSDGDAFTRRAAVGWRPLAEALRDGLDASECSERIERCVARDLRDHGGLKATELQDLLGTSRKAPTESDVVRALESLVRRRCVDPITVLLIGDGSRFTDFGQAAAFTRHCLDSSRLDVIARSLLRDPSGQSIKKPRRTPTVVIDLLNEAAPLGRNA